MQENRQKPGGESVEKKDERGPWMLVTGKRYRNSTKNQTASTEFKGNRAGRRGKGHDVMRIQNSMATKRLGQASKGKKEMGSQGPEMG